MARALLAAALALAMLSACGASTNEERLTPAAAKEAAAQQAQMHLAFFLERLDAKDPADSNFHLTIRLPAEGRQRPRAELGIKDIVAQGSSFHGVIAKPDESWPEFELGETMSFPASIVIDWSFAHKDTLIGAFQLRAGLCTASEAVSKLPQILQDEVRAEGGKAGGLLLDPKDACKPVDPPQDYEKAKARK